MERLNLFETPLFVDNVPDAPALNAALKERILSRCASDTGVRRSNWTGWQSDIDMLDWGGEAAQRLGDHFLAMCNRATALPPGHAPSFLWKLDMWANVARKGASNEAHVHPGAVWSAVYYVEDGSDDSDPERSGGDLILYDPRMPAVRMLPFDLRYRRPDGQPSQSLHPVRPEAGQIVMFPPWLLHSVHPYHGDRERISIAMNVTAIANVQAVP